jgi:tetratricopeptide (TPR) repeat protein
LVKRAETALAAVRGRDLKAKLRHAKYDEILRPLDDMLRIARKIQSSDSYDPLDDYDRIAAYCEPVIRIAVEADEHSVSESSALSRRYRFMEQKGEACQYLATALWNRFEAVHDRAGNVSFDRNGFVPSGDESEKLYSLVDDGLAADPANRELRYLRGILNRANGLFAAAEKDLKKAIELDPEFGAAWNVLGLVMIRLHDFDQSEKAFARAVEILARQAKRAGVSPGAEYATALLNLARVHGALLAHYERLERIEPSVKSRAEALRHRRDMENALQTIVNTTAAGTPEYDKAREMLAGGE